MICFAGLRICLEIPADGEIIGLGAAGCEDDLVRPRVYQRSDLVAGLVDRRAGFLAEEMDARRIAELSASDTAASLRALLGRPGSLRCCRDKLAGT